VVINKHLVKHLQELGLWDKRMMDQIISNNGSVQQILRIPEDVRKIYRTVWEISQKS
jgi:ribonucleotide reductase alpha subunit